MLSFAVYSGCDVSRLIQRGPGRASPRPEGNLDHDMRVETWNQSLSKIKVSRMQVIVKVQAEEMYYHCHRILIGSESCSKYMNVSVNSHFHTTDGHNIRVPSVHSLTKQNGNDFRFLFAIFHSLNFLIVNDLILSRHELCKGTGGDVTPTSPIKALPKTSSIALWVHGKLLKY